MKVALVSDHASPLAAPGGVDSGGQNVYVAHIARHLALAGHYVDVFTRRDNPAQPYIHEWLERVRVVHVPAGPPEALPKEALLPYMEAFGDFLADASERVGYDVIHANFFMSGLAALRAVETVPVPIVTTFHALGRVRRLHQGGADGFPDERFAIEERLLRESARVLAECPQDKQDMLDLYDADPRRIDVVPCGYDVEELRPIDRQIARAELGWSSDAFIVLQLGRMVARKGVDNVIRAIAALKRLHGVSAQLQVVGGNSESPDPDLTPELARLDRIAREQGVRDSVIFTGRRGRDTLPLYYGACDAFVTTPWYEPFGITPVEAMACARPVVGAAVGGIKYTVTDGRTGFLVPPRDPASLARRLALLARDADLCRRMGEAGLQRARRLFTWRRVAKSIARCYGRACGAFAPAYSGARLGGG